jgi:hypothetical protein
MISSLGIRMVRSDGRIHALGGFRIGGTAYGVWALPPNAGGPAVLARLSPAQYRERHALHDISREVIVDHVRDRVWEKDLSPARPREREESLLRAIEREFACE